MDSLSLIGAQNSLSLIGADRCEPVWKIEDRMDSLSLTEAQNSLSLKRAHFFCAILCLLCLIFPK